ncbi:MAG: DUF1549 and DUF1553 domain-containing protein [Pirellula sp.]
MKTILAYCILTCIATYIAVGICTSKLNAQGREFTPDEQSYWALQPVKQSAIPRVFDQDRVQNPIDAFILQRLEAESIKMSVEADRITLIRRASFDLFGLPPSHEEVLRFLADESLDAYERLVDRFLASPEYGERWGRHWLDLAMYAESAGFEQDETRPNAWRYRDYVIDSFNQDKPYDRFVVEQIAGDEVWPDDLKARQATAFMRHYPEEGNNKDILLARQEIMHHVTDLVGATFMGLTLNCAQCHDHKHDPILQKDYYRLQAFFANIGHDDRIPLVERRELEDYQARLAEYERQTGRIWSEIDQLLATVRKYSPQQLLARYPDYVIAAMDAPPNLRTPLQSQIAYILNNKDCGTCPQRPKPHADALFAKDAKSLKGDAQVRYAELQKELDRLQALKPADLPIGTGMIDIGDTPPPTHVLGVGQYQSPKEEVQPGILSILEPGPLAISEPLVGKSSGRRKALAGWLTNPSNPLTARVMVNRVWHYHFGRGIVGTPSDFGALGDPPSHVELLDWMAHRFMQSGWNNKSLHRLIMTSATYRQGSNDGRREFRDPDNRLLWRFPPQRLDAESIRDSALAVSGLMNRQLGGPSVFPPLPAGRPIPAGGWKVSSKRSDFVRRSVYVFVRRNDRFPLLEAFDFPDSHEACACRNQTLTAPQALTMLNGQASEEWSDAFAERVISEVGSVQRMQIERAFQIAFSRSPDEHELRDAFHFLVHQTQLMAIENERDAKANGEADKAATQPTSDDVNAKRALSDFCLMLLNSNEFLFRF